jgi:hypothetical protein
MIEGNQIVPKPERDLAEPPIQAINQMMNGASNDLMATTGLNDASLGERRPDEAAKSVLLRQRQGQVSTSHYSDNVSRAVQFTGRIILSYLKRMDESPRLGRVLKADDTVEHVVLHKNDLVGAKKIAQHPEQRIINLAQGDYDVTVTVGPSYQTKRQEAVESILNLVKAAPQMLQLVGDLLVGNMDWHNAPEIAKRLKIMLPPEVQAAEETGGDPKKKLLQVQGQMQQLMQQHQQMTQVLQQTQQIISTKQIEANSRERVAMINAAAGVEEAVLKSKLDSTLQGGLATLNAELDALNARFQMQHATPTAAPGADNGNTPTLGANL